MHGFSNTNRPSSAVRAESAIAVVVCSIGSIPQFDQCETMSNGCLVCNSPCRINCMQALLTLANSATRQTTTRSLFLPRSRLSPGQIILQLLDVLTQFLRQHRVRHSEFTLHAMKRGELGFGFDRGLLNVNENPIRCCGISLHLRRTPTDQRP